MTRKGASGGGHTSHATECKMSGNITPDPPRNVFDSNFSFTGSVCTDFYSVIDYFYIIFYYMSSSSHILPAGNKDFEFSQWSGANNTHGGGSCGMNG